MAYYTGTFSSMVSLQSIIETQAVANGWSLSGGWLSKGINHVQLTSPDINYLHITGANSTDGLTTPAGYTQAIYIPTANYPATYYLFIHTNPDFVCCVVHYNVNQIQVLFFTDVVKIHSSAYVGGNLFYASMAAGAHGTHDSGDSNLVAARLQEINLTGSGLGSNYFNSAIVCGNNGWTANDSMTHPIPFSLLNGYFADTNKMHGFHAEIDGNIWVGGTKLLQYTDSTIAALFRSPNTWNSQTHLVPMNLMYPMADSLWAYLGYIEHMRFIRVDNYEIGDIVTIAPDEWKVFPWRSKNITYRNGSGFNSTGSGTLGFAVRYNTP